MVARTLVMGAGVIGVTSAYYLARSGHEVTVLERRDGPGLETSFANGGQISASHSEPWANPAAPLKALKWMGREDSPLLFHLRTDPALWAWVMRFLINCTSRRTTINTERTLRVALYSRLVLAELRDETGIEYDKRCQGIIHIYRDSREFERALSEAEFMSRLGCTRRGLDPRECVSLEPALAAASEVLVGGTFSPDDESGDAHKFTRRLAEICTSMGVEFRYQVNIKNILHQGRRIVGIETSDGVLRADNYVVAMGSYSPVVVRPLGITLPVYPSKGYSITIPVDNPEKAPLISITDDERKLVFSRLGEKLRVAGTAEFAGYDTRLNKKRARSVMNGAFDLFPGCGEPSRAEYWTGLRPTTPDSVPVIGPTKYSNLTLNTGHGTLGWTMACGSGRIVADLLNGIDPEINMEGLSVERFSRSL